MHDVKKIYKKMKPKIIRNEQKKPVEAFFDVKSYEIIMETIQQWKKIQRETGVRWVKVKSKPSKTKK